MSGESCKLGFLFLYNLLSGRLRVRICGGNDSHRLATLMSQLYFDRKDKTMMNSVVNVLIRNPAFCARLPRFKDTRKMSRVPRFNGWTDDREPVSPLHNLFQALVPQLREYGDMKIVRYPPPPPHPTLASPLCEYVIIFERKSSNASLNFTRENNTQIKTFNHSKITNTYVILTFEHNNLGTRFRNTLLEHGSNLKLATLAAKSETSEKSSWTRSYRCPRDANMF